MGKEKQDKREMREKEMRRDEAKQLKGKVGEKRRRKAKGGEERKNQGNRWKGERHKCHGIDGIPCLSSRVEKQHTAVSQVSQVAPIDCQQLPWLLSPQCRYRVALPIEHMQRGVSPACVCVCMEEKER